MKPVVKEFQDDVKLMKEVQRQAANGVSKDNLYVVSHDDDRTDRVAGKVEANEPDELGELVGARYNKKGDELRKIFQEFGFTSDEAGDLEEKLDHGTIFLLINS